MGIKECGVCPFIAWLIDLIESPLSIVEGDLSCIKNRLCQLRDLRLLGRCDLQPWAR